MDLGDTIEPMGFPGGSVVKNLPATAGAVGYAGSIPGLGISPGVGNGNPPQYTCLGNSIDRGAWQATVHGVAKSRTQLSTAQLRKGTSTQAAGFSDPRRLHGR